LRDVCRSPSVGHDASRACGSPAQLRPGTTAPRTVSVYILHATCNSPCPVASSGADDDEVVRFLECEGAGAVRLEPAPSPRVERSAPAGGLSAAREGVEVGAGRQLGGTFPDRSSLRTRRMQRSRDRRTVGNTIADRIGPFKLFRSLPPKVLRNVCLAPGCRVHRFMRDRGQYREGLVGPSKEKNVLSPCTTTNFQETTRAGLSRQTKEREVCVHDG
jgi:hypothetical protein